MKTPIAPTLFLALLTAACSSSGPEVRQVDASLLASLPEKSMVEIDQARARLSVAEDTLGKRRKAAEVAASQAEVAAADLNVARSELEQAKAQEKLAEKTGSALDVAAARRVRAVELFEMGVKREELVVAERERDLANVDQSVAEATLRTRKSEVEYEKARAVSALDLAETATVSVPEFQKEVFGNEMALSAAEGRLAGAKQALLEAKIKLTEAQQKLDDQLRQNRAEELAEHPEPAPAPAPRQ